MVPPQMNGPYNPRNIVAKRAGTASHGLTPQPPSLHLEQKFEGLQVAARFGHRFTPSIKPMTAQESSVRVRMLFKRRGQSGRQVFIILRVLDDRHALLVRVRSDTGKPLQQFVAFEGHVACGSETPR